MIRDKLEKTTSVIPSVSEESQDSKSADFSASPRNDNSKIATSPFDSLRAPRNDDGGVFKDLSKLVLDALNKFFKPELLNRFDEIVIFEPLSQNNMLEIAKLGIEGTRKLLKDKQVDLQISATALSQLAKEGYDPVYGARPLRRIIQKSLENPIAIYLINKSLVGGETIMVDYNSEGDKFTFSKIQNNVTSR